MCRTIVVALLIITISPIIISCHQNQGEVITTEGIVYTVEIDGTAHKICITYDAGGIFLRGDKEAMDKLVVLEESCSK